MRALLQSGYGPARQVLRIGDAPEPEPGAGQVRIRVHAGSLAAGDRFMLAGEPLLGRLVWGWSAPRDPIPGLAVAGVVDRVGSGCTDFAVGDAIFGELESGGFAEYAVVPEAGFAAKPDALSFEEAAALVVSAPTAYQGWVEVAEVQPGDRVLINGASGAVGTFAIQIAKALGAEVTGVCSARNADQARALGADRVVDYTREDFAAHGPIYDALFDLAGSRTLAECRRVLKPDGTYICSTGTGGRIAGPMVRILGVLLANLVSKQRLAVLSQRVDRKGLEDVVELVLAGKVQPVIEQVHDFGDIVGAYEALEHGHARGKRVIRWTGPPRVEPGSP